MCSCPAYTSSRCWQDGAPAHLQQRLRDIDRVRVGPCALPAAQHERPHHPPTSRPAAPGWPAAHYCPPPSARKRRRSATVGSRPMLRVAYVVDEWVTLSQTFIREEVAELRRQGVHVEVVALEHGDSSPRDDEPAVVLADLLPANPIARSLSLVRRPLSSLRLVTAAGAHAAGARPLPRDPARAREAAARHRCAVGARALRLGSRRRGRGAGRDARPRLVVHGARQRHLRGQRAPGREARPRRPPRDGVPVQPRSPAPDVSRPPPHRGDRVRRRPPRSGDQEHAGGRRPRRRPARAEEGLRSPGARRRGAPIRAPRSARGDRR